MMKILYILVIMYISAFIYGQDPNKPVIKSVCVINVDGAVKIEWVHSQHPDLHEYEISRLDKDDTDGNPNKIAVVSKTDTSYIDNSVNANIGSIGYRVTVLNNLGNRVGGAGSEIHKTMYLEVETDPCYGLFGALKFDWTPYIGWQSGQDSGVYIYKVLSRWKFVKDYDRGLTDTTSNTNFNLEIIPKDSTYYWIRAEKKTDLSIYAVSNAIVVDKPFATIPNYIYPNYATVSGKTIEIQFSIDPASGVEDYTLVRELNGNIDSLWSSNTFSDTVFTYTDNAIDVRKQYNYYLTAYYCSEPIENIVTDYANNIVLNAKMELSDYNIILNWNEYDGWIEGTEKYILYRSIDDGSFTIVSNNILDEEYEENVLDFLNDEDYPVDSLRYYVEAYEILNQYTDQNICKSNITAVYPDLDCVFPNTIVINDVNPDNQYFKPKCLIVPLRMEITIYSKGGSKVWWSENLEDISIGWDGTNLVTGKRVPDGMYYYVVRRSNSDGKIIKEPDVGVINVISANILNN